MGGIRGWLRRLERREDDQAAIRIPQRDGTVRRFPQSAFADAFLTNSRLLNGEDVPQHPLTSAIENGTDRTLHETFYSRMTLGDEASLLEDLSEPADD